MDYQKTMRSRIMYRGIDLSEVKDPEEKKRIQKIKKLIELKQEELTDFEIGDAFM